MNVNEPIDAEVIDQPVEEVKGLEFAKWEIKMIFNQALSGIKVNDIKKEDKLNLIKLKIELGEYASKLQEYEKSVIDALKNDEYIQAEKAAQSADASNEVKSKFEELMHNLEKEANDTCMKEYNTIVTIDCEKLSKDVFYCIADTIQLELLGGYDYIYNKLVKK